MAVATEDMEMVHQAFHSLAEQSSVLPASETLVVPDAQEDRMQPR